MNHLGLTDKAYNIIKDRLLKGEIKPGSRIREDILAAEISMSRTPVRESINKLAAEGFVYQIPRKGIFATEPSIEELLDIIEIRVIIETYAAKKCCINIKDEQIKEFEDVFENYKEALHKEEWDKIGLYDGKFHRKLGEYSGNKRIQKYVDEIEDWAVYARRMNEYNFYHEYSEEESVKQHEDILKAIKERDEEAAANAVEINTKELLKRMRFNDSSQSSQMI